MVTDMESSGGRPLVGPALFAIGVLHVAMTPLFYGDGLAAIVDDGVFAALSADAADSVARSAAYWYLAAGLAVLLLGALAWWTERRVGGVPALFGWLLLAFTAYGVVILPSSGFWLFAGVAVLAFRSARRLPPVGSHAGRLAS